MGICNKLIKALGIDKNEDKTEVASIELIKADIDKLPDKSDRGCDLTQQVELPQQVDQTLEESGSGQSNGGS